VRPSVAVYVTVPTAPMAAAGAVRLLGFFCSSAGPAEIVVPPLSTRVAIGGQLLLYCRATGSPMPEVVFLKGGRLLPSRLPSSTRLIDGDFYSLLVIKPVRMVDSGVYQCQASNSQPPATVTATATVQVLTVDQGKG